MVIHVECWSLYSGIKGEYTQVLVTVLVSQYDSMLYIVFDIFL